MAKTFHQEPRPLKQRLLILPARDRNHPDKLTITLHGSQTEDRARLVNRLADLIGEMQRDGVNVSFVVTADAEPEA